MHKERRPKVIIIGAGFGGLHAAKGLAKQDVDVLIIDRNNFHTFTPLLYQVATSGIDPSEIAYPVRGIFQRAKNIDFRLGTVTHIDYEGKQVTINSEGIKRAEDYDHLIVAAGSTTNYFGNGELERFAFGMKDLSEAIILRNHILRLFERVAWIDDPEERRALTTLVVVGGGPTGLETAGAFFELLHYVLKRENGHLAQANPRVILVEAMDKLLRPYPEKLQHAALEQLESLGVEVMLGAMVDEVGKQYVKLKDGTEIKTHTLVWAAGVKASPLAEMLDVELQRGGRIPVTPELEVIGRENVYAIGDIAYLENPEDGQAYPQLIPVAKQQGKLIAENILNQDKGKAAKSFSYRDRGIMATIGRSRAVAWPFYKVQLTGWFAWVTWLMLHLVWLMGFRNQLSVFVGWVWNYFTYDRSVRIILDRDVEEATQQELRVQEEQEVPAA